MEDPEVSVTLKMSQWQVALNELAQAKMPWAQSNGIIAAILRAGQAAADALKPADETDAPAPAARTKPQTAPETEATA